MASTNQTSNLELSQFIGSDSPKWLTDYNSDMEKIDAGYGSVKAQADATDLIVSGHTASITSLTDSVGDQATAIQNMRTDVTANTGSINTINSLIGNGEPTTTDKTIIGAINEIYADITGSGDDVEAENVSYDNTTSGLTATDVQAAIDELASAPAGSWQQFGTTQTTSGNVSDAVALPSTFEEVQVVFHTTGTRYAPITFNKAMLSSTDQSYRMGYYEANNYYGDLVCTINNSHVYGFIRKDGSTVTTSVDIYYK